MTMPPMTAQEMHAKITVARKTTVPGQTQYSSEGVVYQVEIDVPAGQKVIDAIHMAQADLEILIGEFKSAHLLKTEKPSLIHFPGVQGSPPSRPSPPSPPTEPALEWIQSKNNPTVEFIPTDRPGVQSFHELAKQREKGYWLNQDGTLIFRYKKAT